MESVVCGSCGARIRSNRPRCLRCGVPLRPTPETEPRRARRDWLRVGAVLIVTAALSAAALSLAGLSLNRSGEARTALAAPAANTSRTAAARPEAAARVSAGPSAAEVDGHVVAADATRVGVAAYGRGDTAAALDAFEAAATAAPGDADALNNFAQTLVRAGRARQALPYLAKAVALRPDSWAFRFNEARAHGELEDWPRAIAGYRAAAELFPDDYVTQFNLGKALEAGGKPDGAAEVRRRYLELAPDSEKP